MSLRIMGARRNTHVMTVITANGAARTNVSCASKRNPATRLNAPQGLFHLRMSNGIKSYVIIHSVILPRYFQY
jgi:hypothetical protein